MIIWTESVLYKNEHEKGSTVKQSISALYPIQSSILNLDLDLSKMLDIASWISPFIHQLNIPVSVEDMGLISYLYSTYSLQDLGIFLSQYFIPIS